MTAAADLPGNLFHLPTPLPPEEIFTALVETPHLRIERIVSSGQISPPDQWYDQDQAEWVVLIQGEAELTYGDGTTQRLQPGGYVLIPPHVRHRVTYTSTEPPCIWLAVHWPEP
jgi:cupin 2 domain-containing protein